MIAIKLIYFHRGPASIDRPVSFPGPIVPLIGGYRFRSEKVAATSPSFLDPEVLNFLFCFKEFGPEIVSLGV